MGLLKSQSHTFLKLITIFHIFWWRRGVALWLYLIFWAQEQEDFSVTRYVKFGDFDCVQHLPAFALTLPLLPPAKLFEAAL